MDYDEEGEPLFDPGARFDKQTSAQGHCNWERGDAFSAGAESGEASRPKSKSRKRLINRIDDVANHQRLPGHASYDEELFDEPVLEVLRKKPRKEKSSKQQKDAEFGGMLDKLALLANCGKQSEKPQPSRACGHGGQQGGEQMKHLLDSIAPAENNEDIAVLAMDDDALTDHTGVDPEVSVAGSDEESDSSGDAPQAEEGEENDDLNSNCKSGMSKNKNYEGKAEDTALLVEEFMARLEVAAEEDAELKRQSKPAINKLKMLPSLLSVLSKRQLQQEFLDRGVLSVLKNWLESLPDGSLSNMTLRSALLKLITEKGESSNSHHKVSDSPNVDVALTSRTTKPDNLTKVRQEPPSVTSQTQACQDVLRNIFSTEEFGILSNILNYGSSLPSGSLEATLQSKASTSLSSFLDLELISLRFSSGVYGHTPQLFSDDIQQVWKNVHSFGSTLVKLARGLSEYSDKLYKEQVLSLFQVQHNNTAPSKCEELMVLSGHTTEAGSQALLDPNRAGGRPRQQQRIKQATNILVTRNSKHYTADSVCKECGLKESVNSIVCSHCHAVYHKECVNLNSNSSPRGWYCPSCTIKTDGRCSRIITSRQGTRRNHSSLQTQVSIHKQMTNDTSQSCKAAVKAIDKGGVCQVCGKDDEDVLLCDTCDDAYHMYCLAPPIDSVPEGFWYCPKCAELEKKSVVVHENPHVGHHCAVCDRLWIESLQLVAAEHLEEGGVSASVTESPEHRADSVGMQSPQQLSAHNPNVCKVCRVADKKPKISCSGCEKRFHLSCLGQTVKKKPNGVWYCPSCLCRVCNVDANDDKIVLCDDCDEAYHIYCLVPALPEIPQGSWYCPACVG